MGNAYRQYKFKFYLNMNHYIIIDDKPGEVHPHTWEIIISVIATQDDMTPFASIERKMEEIMDLDEDTLTMDSLLDDIDEWDSLSVLSLTVYAKKTLGIDLETSVIISFKTINDIYIKCFGGD